MNIVQFFIVFAIFSAAAVSFIITVRAILREYLGKKKKKTINAEKCLVLERKKQYSIFLAQSLRQTVNDLYFRITEPSFNSDDLIYILNKNGLYIVDVDTFDQSYYKGE